MKEIKKFEGFNRHLRIFILISITFFILAGIAHIRLLVHGEHLYFGETMLPHSVNYFALFGVIWMSIMGLYYYFALAPRNHK